MEVVTLNRIHFEELVIDPHFEIKHGESMDDEIILELVNQLDGRELDPIAIDRDGFRYYRTEPMYFKGKPYRLIWLTLIVTNDEIKIFSFENF